MSKSTVSIVSKFHGEISDTDNILESNRQETSTEQETNDYTYR